MLVSRRDGAHRVGHEGGRGDARMHLVLQDGEQARFHLRHRQVMDGGRGGAIMPAAVEVRAPPPRH